MRKILLLLFVSMVISGTGSIYGDDTDSDKIFSADVYYPLAVGAEKFFIGKSTNYSILEKIIGIETLNGKSYFRIENLRMTKNQGKEPPVLRETSVLYERISDNSVYSYNDSGEKLLFNFNLKPFEPWEAYRINEDWGISTRTITIVAQGVTVEVPAGKFDNCLVYEMTHYSFLENKFGRNIWTFWVAPNIGIVKRIININDNGLELANWLEELGNYTMP